MSRQCAVYMMANKRNGTIYIDVTNHILRRVYEHKSALTPGFTKKYNCHRLVYYECGSVIVDAISREKQLKSKSRKSKIALIERINPTWCDLYPMICQA